MSRCNRVTCENPPVDWTIGEDGIGYCASCIAEGERITAAHLRLVRAVRLLRVGVLTGTCVAVAELRTIRMREAPVRWRESTSPWPRNWR